VAEREAYWRSVRRPVGELDPLVHELIEIGAAGNFLTRGGPWERTREIGALLDARGGMSEMRAAHQQVESRFPMHGRALDMAWDGIGDWRG
jgi:hypothetical protein